MPTSAPCLTFASIFPLSERIIASSVLPTPVTATFTEVVPNELIRYRITKGGILKDHEGVLRFTSRGDGSHLDWTITFDGKAPGIAPIVKAKLTRDVSRAIRKLAATGSA